jgi:hypothetical protein
VASEAYSYFFGGIGFAPDVNLAALLQDHVVAEERGQGGVGPTIQTIEKQAQGCGDLGCKTSRVFRALHF